MGLFCFQGIIYRKEDFMAYTPELSQRDSGILRRIAWALDQPMTRTLECVIEWIGDKMDRQQVCSSCRDKTFCPECVFQDER